MDRLGQSNELLVLALDVNGPARAVVASCRAYARFGRNDVLVNNAGYGIIAAVEEETAEEVEALFRTNAFALLAVTHAILPLMRTQSAGRILNLLVTSCLSRAYA
jgi:short-subunit dehydrogenase